MLSLSKITNKRLVQQQLLGPSFKTTEEMVGWLGAVQAQEYALSKWSLGMRMEHLNDENIEKPFSMGKILRTHLLRPTWHFVTAQDIRWLLMLTAPRVHAANAYMYRKLELDAAIFNRCNDMLTNILQGGKHLTRSAINLELKNKKIEAEGLRLTYIMMQAELEGIICSGTRQGKQFTYALLEERVPACKQKNREEALAELTIRYFSSRGPATLQDFSTWSGLTITDCKKGVSMVYDKLLQEKWNEEEYIFSAETLSPNLKSFQHMLLLPVYDEFIMGYKNREAIQMFRNSISPTPMLHFYNTIIFEGQIIGTWKGTTKTKCIDLIYHFFKSPQRKQLSAFRSAVDHFEAFNKLPVNLIALDS